MGILRTDKVSGLETPTAVTGSVYFDGDARNDNLNMSADYGDLDFQNTDFTFESWVYPTDMSIDRYWCSKGDGNLPGTAMDVRFDSDGQINISFYVSSTAYTLNTAVGVLRENVWSHVAVVRNGTSFKSYVNGKETSSATHNITVSDVSATFIIGILQGVGTGFKGYMSNFRFVRGKAVYIGEFTPSIYALEPIDGTVLLCCNNPDSVTAVSLAAVGTSKAIIANGDVSIASTSPGLTRDFTSGTEFQGVTVFDTQGYFVPPSGTTEQRGRGRGLFGGGSAPSTTNSIDYIQIQTQGNAQDFGDLTLARKKLAAAASATRGLFAGGDPGTNVINFVTIASTGDAVDFGDLVAVDQDLGGAANNTRGLFFGGSPSENTIQYVTIASLGNAQDFGDLTRDENSQRGCGSPTRCIIFERDASIDFVTFATTGNGTDFGDTIAENYNISACSDSTRGIRIGGGASPSTSNEYITIATLGNSQNFGSLTATSTQGHAVSDSKRGVISIGDDGNRTNAMDYITIQTTGNAQDFGDLTAPRDDGASSSDSHGGIS